MLIIPLQSADHSEDALVVVLNDSGIVRMREADPAEIVLRHTGKRLVNPTVLICLENDVAAVNKFVQLGDVRGLIKHLQRGFKFRPESGDHDRGPESVHSFN